MNSNSFKCSFCRNEGANNKHKYDNNPEYVFYMCDDCDARYKEHKQLGPKFVVCNCNPEHPKELDLAMAKEEIEQNKKIEILPIKADLGKIVWETSGPIVKSNDDETKDNKPITKRSKRKKERMFQL